MNFSDHQFLLYAFFAAGILIARLPFVGKFFRVTNTLIHESGHAIMALLTSGNVVSIDLMSDTSGTATTKSKYLLFKILIALSGYIFSSATALLLFYLISKAKYTWVFYIFCVFALVNLLFWVRNAFGIFWLILFSTVLGVIYYYRVPNYMFAASVFFSTVVLAESVFSAAVILYISFSEPAKAGDAKNLKDFTYIPAAIWGLLFFAQAIYFAYLAVRLFV